jgi:Glycosyl transferases group 1
MPVHTMSPRFCPAIAQARSTNEIGATPQESLPTTRRFPVNDLRLLETGSSHAGSRERIRGPNERGVKHCRLSEFLGSSPALTDCFTSSNLLLIRSVISDKGGRRHAETRELIEAEKSGLVFEAGNEQGLATSIRRLRDDPALGRRLAAAARERTERQYSIGNCADPLLTCLLRSPASIVMNPELMRTSSLAPRSTLMWISRVDVN